VRERGSIYPAPILSDGTLRFAAIAAAFFQPDMPDVLTVEEIENGIHPSRVRLLVELLRSQSGRSGRQVMATTHSPVVLSWLKPSDYGTTFHCTRDDETGESHITPLSEVPMFQSVVQKQPIGELFAELWLENAL
jgi:predicted ATPase